MGVSAAFRPSARERERHLAAEEIGEGRNMPGHPTVRFREIRGDAQRFIGERPGCRPGELAGRRGVVHECAYRGKVPIEFRRELMTRNIA